MKSLLLVIIITSYLTTSIVYSYRVASRNDTIDISEESSGHSHDIPHTALIGWKWAEVQTYLVVSVFLLMAALAKIGYHHLSPVIHSHVPESCVLIVLGTAIGSSYKWMGVSELVPFDSGHFFFLLLPPIILESAYSLHDKAFFYNIRTILLYAVVGTLINVALIGLSLYGLSQVGLFESEINVIECFTFSTIISAVDPVAVLAIFHEIGVNKSLYFLVFGESLLNDAVVIVLYSTVTTFAALPVVTSSDFVIGIFSFFTVSGGGLIIGIIIGCLTALMTKTTESVRVVEPFVVIVMAYLSYVVAELFHFSGIISLIACGLVQYEYIGDNIAPDSLTTIKYFTKTMSSISDVIIFFYLGRVLVRDDHTWDSNFVGFSTLFCVIYRFVSVFLLTAIANRFMQSIRRINLGEQFLMAYGGLRGAIAFSLAVSLDSDTIQNSKLFVTTSLFIILFTVFFLGSTTKPVIRWLEVKLHEEDEKLMFTDINDRVVETIMSAVEEVSGVASVHSLTVKFHRINDNILKRFLTKGDMHSFKHTFAAVRMNSIRRSKKILGGVDNPQFSKDSIIDVDKPAFEVESILEEEDDVFSKEPSNEVVLRDMKGRMKADDKAQSTSLQVIGYRRRDSKTTTRSASPHRPGHVYVRYASQRHLRHPRSPHLPVVQDPMTENQRNRRRSTVSGRRVVNDMFAHSSYYHLPRRDSITSPTTPIDVIPPSSARSIFSFFPSYLATPDQPVPHVNEDNHRTPL